MNDSGRRKLRLTFHGRIIDHLGIQMYQSPVAAVAELVANAWDADAEKVSITLPSQLREDSEIVIKDDGLGMTFQECQDRYLNVGWCRRGNDMAECSQEKRRAILGRKGIGKFAGFGVADVIRIETVSKRTGEKTVFELNINELRSDKYVSADGKEISVIEHQPAEDVRKKDHSTIITLKSLKLGRCPSQSVFSKSMARRYLVRQQTEDFKVLVNGKSLPETEQNGSVEFAFPRDYKEKEEPKGLLIDGDWGVEKLPTGKEIRWRIVFYKDPIEDEELKGVAIFSKVKLAQRPFFFNLSGGLGGQHGQEYLSGQVRADYIDQLDEDIIATERQRVNWEHPETVPLEKWGQNRVKRLLVIWKQRRGEKRRMQIEKKVVEFSPRLERLPPHEKRTVRSALDKVGSISALSDDQFRELGEAMLKAWEQGRLRGLIDDLAQTKDITTESLLTMLTEADVLVALNLAEAVKTKLEAIRGLRTLVEAGQLENAVRDYIAEKPYLLDPKWETFKKETSVKWILDEAAEGSGLLSEEDNEYEHKRIDLALRSNEHLLVVEFMRPGKTADFDHLSRCRAYIHLVRDKVESQTGLEIEKVTGLIVADKLANKAQVRREIPELRKSDIYAFSWDALLGKAEQTWREFLEIVGERAPDDDRLRSLREK